jgi:hypothetical protein
MKNCVKDQKSGRPMDKKKIASAFLLAVLFFLGSVLADVADARARRPDRHGRTTQKTAVKKRAGKPNKKKKLKIRKVKRGKKSPIKKNADDKVVFMQSPSDPTAVEIAGGTVDRV